MNKYVIMLIESNWYSLDINDFDNYTTNCDLIFSDDDYVISFQTSDLIRSFISTGYSLPNIIDLESFDKQMSQEGKDIRCFDNWKAINMLKHHKIIDDNFLLSETTFKTFLEQIASFYLNHFNNNTVEIERFENIETKVNEIIYERQKLGLTINIVKAEQKSKSIEKEIYKIKNILQLQYRIFSPDNKKQQVEWLNKKGYTVFESILNSFKVRKDQDYVCKLFYDLIRYEGDLDGMLYILGRWGGGNKVYPSYHGFGTITSRITLREPALQNFRKENRCIIVPEVGKKFLYVDYSQFEAGILASLSKEEQLIKLYNDDIYKNLAQYVYNNGEKRSEAKIIFYRFMYGDKTLGKKEKKELLYFARFKKLLAYKKKIDLEIKENQSIGTNLGNSRICNGDEECTWGLSHIIQSTASLIFKRALIRVNVEVNNTEFLIPMHDAALYQISEFVYENCKEKIIEIFKDEFKKECPEIIPRVNCDDFYTE
jgi:DNA polymerase I-like protein with 3'-5' exonuclease and polymerase domains